MGEGKESNGVTKQSRLSFKIFLWLRLQENMKTILFIQQIFTWDVQFAKRNIMQCKKIIRQRNKRQYPCFHWANTDIITPHAPHAGRGTHWCCLWWMVLISWVSPTQLLSRLCSIGGNYYPPSYCGSYSRVNLWKQRMDICPSLGQSGLNGVR